jgi:cytoskeleton protein RodZ
VNLSGLCVDTPSARAYIFVGPRRMSSTPFGEHLRRERELRGVSLEEIAAATRISTRFLEALENEQWDRLPGGAFNRGFIRSIARFLGMDEDGLVAEYAYERKSIDDARAGGHSGKIPRAWGSAVFITLLAAAAIAAGFWGFGHFRGAIAARLGGRFAGSAAASGGATTPTPGAAAPVLTPMTLAIRASQPADLTVSADGQTVFAGILQASDVKRFEAHETLEIATSDSTAFVFTLNGQLVAWAPVPGEPGKMKLTRNDLPKPAEASH